MTKFEMKDKYRYLDDPDPDMHDVTNWNAALADIETFLKTEIFEIYDEDILTKAIEEIYETIDPFMAI